MEYTPTCRQVNLRRRIRDLLLTGSHLCTAAHLPAGRASVRACTRAQPSQRLQRKLRTTHWPHQDTVLQLAVSRSAASGRSTTCRRWRLRPDSEIQSIAIRLSQGAQARQPSRCASIRWPSAADGLGRLGWRLVPTSQQRGRPQQQTRIASGNKVLCLAVWVAGPLESNRACDSAQRPAGSPPILEWQACHLRT